MLTMSDALMVIIISCFVPWLPFGAVIATSDINNKEVPLPKDFYEDGYNWFGSWFLFVARLLVAFPFYVIGIIVCLVAKFIKWLFTVGR